MHKEYHIEGMGCEGCVNSVKLALQKVSGVSHADVKLNPPIATLTTDKPIDIKELQSSLSEAGYYKIREQ
ncbi:MAG: heavy-metal-associated domain-containing protein [Bacteroidetes bacterium]|jgi:copper chaperone CopZ|nr:heavy-metal-associated domain-containing protein [Bacteroidota bacterium]